MNKMKTPTSAEEHARYMKEGSDGRTNYKASVGNIGDSRNVRNESDPKNRGGDYFSGSPSSFGGARNASLSKQAGNIDQSHSDDHAQHERTREEAPENKKEASTSWGKEKNDEKR
ncbi:hypothetical protein WKI45_12665 [Delftia tsuruhatensis]